MVGSEAGKGGHLPPQAPQAVVRGGQGLEPQIGHLAVVLVLAEPHGRQREQVPQSSRDPVDQLIEEGHG